MRLNRNRNIGKFIALYSIYFALISIFWGFSVPVFSSKLSFSIEQIGVGLAIITISDVLGVLFSGYLCDKFKTIKRVQIGFTILYTIASIIIFIDKSTILNYMNIALLGFSFGGANVLLENWVIEFGEDIKNYFGPIRSMGAFTWAIVNLTLGNLYTSYGYQLLPLLSLSALVIYLIIAYKISDASKGFNKDKKVNQITINDIKNIFNKKFIYTLILLNFVGISMILNNRTLVLRVNSLALNDVTKILGMFYFIAAISEVIMFIYSKKLIEKYSALMLLSISALSVTIAPLISMMVTNVDYMVFLGIFSLTSFAPFLVAYKRLIDDVADKKLRTSSHTIALAITKSVESLILLILGFLVVKIGFEKSFVIYSVIGSISIVLIIKLRKLLNN